MSEYRVAGKTATIGPKEPYRDIGEALGEFAKETIPDYSCSPKLYMQKLAWFLGMKGHTAAAQEIMKHAGERERFFVWGIPIG